MIVQSPFQAQAGGSVPVRVSGVRAAGEVLTAHVAASLGGTPTYQWQRSNDGETWADLAGATGSTRTVTNGDQGRHLRVVVSGLSGTSAPAAIPAGEGGDPPSVAIEALVDFSTGNSGTSSTNHSITLARAVESGNSVLIAFSATSNFHVATAPAGCRLLVKQNIGGDDWAGGRNVWWYIRENITDGIASLAFTTVENTVFRVYGWELAGAPAYELDDQAAAEVAGATAFAGTLDTTANDTLMFGFASTQPSRDPLVDAPNDLLRLISVGAISEHAVSRQAPTLGENTVGTYWTGGGATLRGYAIALRAAE